MLGKKVHVTPYTPSLIILLEVTGAARPVHSQYPSNSSTALGLLTSNSISVVVKIVTASILRESVESDYRVQASASSFAQAYTSEAPIATEFASVSATAVSAGTVQMN